MRLTLAVSAAVVLASATLVAPVMSLSAQQEPVAPWTERSVIPAPTAPKEAEGLPVVGALTRDLPEGTDIMGVSFTGPTPARLGIAVRRQTDGAWSPWTRLPMSDLAPDPHTAEAARARTGTEPLSVEGVDSVQVQVTSASGAPRDLRADFVEAGMSAADATVGSRPANSASATAAKPTIYTRATWGADETLRNCPPEYADTVKGTVVHHTVNSNTYTASDVPALIRGIYAYHTTTLGWCDIGYNFIVDRFGRIFEGRYGGDYRNVIGAHTQGFNAQTVGVASLGDHTSAAPSSATTSAIGALLGWKAWVNGFDPRTSVTYTSAGNPSYPEGTVITRPRVSGHRDVQATECPGDLMYTKLPSIRTTAGAAYDAGAVAAATTQPETYTRPAGTSISFAGRGAGHGRGMSQWGAYGAATKGLTWGPIIGFYYPNTSLVSTYGNPTMRVQLTAVGSGGTQVAYVSGLKMTDGSTTVSLYKKTSTGSTVARWQIVPDGSGLSLQWLEGGTWHFTSTWRQVTTPLTFLNSTTGTVRVVIPGGHMRDYRGQVRTHRVSAGATSINLVPLQSYLYGVVPAEMPASWSTEALKAQSVAARTYAAYQKAHQPSGSLFDTCDSTNCQVYKGVVEYTSSGSVYRTYEDSRSTSAVKITNGYAVMYSGAPALTEFSAANGGITVGSSLPYQVVKSDPYDGVVSGSLNRWTGSLAISTIEKAYATTGTFKALKIGTRTGTGQWGGRMSTVTVVGASGSTTVTGEAFRLKVGLRSNWWIVTSAPAVSAPAHPKDLTSDQLADLLAIDPSGNLKVLKGNGAGAFTPAQVASGWGNIGLVANLGPWDPDNRADVIERDGDTLHYHPGFGNGTLQPRIKIGTGWSVINLILGTGDFDGDGHNDFLARRADTGYLVVYRGTGDGKILKTIYVGGGWDKYRLIVAPGDVTGDRKPDVLAVRASDNAMLLFPGTGTGGVQAGVSVTGSWAGYGAIMGAGDVTGDGRNDLVGRRASDGSLVIVNGNSMGAFTVGATVSGTAWNTWTRWTP